MKTVARRRAYLGRSNFGRGVQFAGQISPARPLQLNGDEE
jgi:hypothetical protein